MGDYMRNEDGSRETTESSCSGCGHKGKDFYKYCERMTVESVETFIECPECGKWM